MTLDQVEIVTRILAELSIIIGGVFWFGWRRTP